MLHFLNNIQWYSSGKVQWKLKKTQKLCPDVNNKNCCFPDAYNQDAQASDFEHAYQNAFISIP